MTGRHEVEHPQYSPHEMVNPSQISQAYMEDAHQEALRFDPKEKKLRDEAKKKLTHAMLEAIERHGIGQIEQVTSEKTGEEFEKEARQTPLVPFPLDGSVIGVRLTEELAVVQKFKDGLYLGEEPVVGMIHLTQHNPETGEQIGRNSAGVLGSEFVTNAAKGQATRQQIEGLTSIVEDIDRFLSRKSGSSVNASVTLSQNGEVPREG